MECVMSNAFHSGRLNSWCNVSECSAGVDLGNAAAIYVKLRGDAALQMTLAQQLFNDCCICIGKLSRRATDRMFASHGVPFLGWSARPS